MHTTVAGQDKSHESRDAGREDGEDNGKEAMAGRELRYAAAGWIEVNMEQGPPSESDEIPYIRAYSEMKEYNV